MMHLFSSNDQLSLNINFTIKISHLLRIVFSHVFSVIKTLLSGMRDSNTCELFAINSESFSNKFGRS